jgi:hypothetical protein
MLPVMCMDRRRRSGSLSWLALRVPHLLPTHLYKVSEGSFWLYEASLNQVGRGSVGLDARHDPCTGSTNVQESPHL